MTRYEIQDENGRPIADYDDIDNDAEAVRIIGMMLASGVFARSPRRLVRIEEETPEEADKARLDWLAVHGDMDFMQSWRYSYTFENSTDTPRDFRAAIDHARGYEPKATVIKEYP